MAKTPLTVVGAEKLSNVVDWQDRTTCVLFGDGAGAAVIETTETLGVGILGNLLGSDGVNAELMRDTVLRMPRAGALTPAPVPEPRSRRRRRAARGAGI